MYSSPAVYACALLQQLQSAESDLESQTKLVLSLQESLNAATKEKEVIKLILLQL